MLCITYTAVSNAPTWVQPLSPRDAVFQWHFLCVCVCLISPVGFRSFLDGTQTSLRDADYSVRVGAFLYDSSSEDVCSEASYLAVFFLDFRAIRPSVLLAVIVERFHFLQGTACICM